MNQNIDKEYQNIFREIKEEKMDWDFEDFLKKTEENASEKKIIPLQKKSGGGNQKWYWLAASLVTLFGMMMFFNPDITEPTMKPVITENTTPNQNLKVENITKTEPTINETNNNLNNVVNIAPKMVTNINNTSTKKIKKQFTKEQSNIASVEIKKIDKSKENKENSPDDYQADYVIVNGKKIYNEEEAISITKEAFNLIASNVTKTINQAEPIKNLSINF